MSARVTVGVSLKMYFGNREAADWCVRIAEIARQHPAIVSGDVELFVIPGYLQIVGAIAALSGTPVAVGAQDASDHDSGAFTGEVSPREIAEVGATLVEVGHAERRRMFGETDDVVAAKTRAALRNGLRPVLCVGETVRTDAAEAGRVTISQLMHALDDAPSGGIVIAYEPVWAIGAAEPAPVEHISAICRALRAQLERMPERAGSVVIYGGSAGPGLLTALEGNADGLFLGRFAHDPDSLVTVLDEAAALAVSRSGA